MMWLPTIMRYYVPAGIKERGTLHTFQRSYTTLLCGRERGPGVKYFGSRTSSRRAVFFLVTHDGFRVSNYPPMP